jgi:hypothetical protein
MTDGSDPRIEQIRERVRGCMTDHPDPARPQYVDDIAFLLTEIDRLRYAFSQACFDGWPDGASAMSFYLDAADKREREPE